MVAEGVGARDAGVASCVDVMEAVVKPSPHVGSGGELTAEAMMWWPQLSIEQMAEDQGGSSG